MSTFSISRYLPSQAISQADNHTAGCLVTEEVSLAKPSHIRALLEKVSNKEFVLKAAKALAFVVGLTLGVCGALSMVGLMATPVGWALSGALLLTILVGVAYYGSWSDFKEAATYALLGFGSGFCFAVGGYFGTLATALTGPEKTLMAVKSLQLFICGSLTPLIVTQIPRNLVHFFPRTR